MNHSAFSLAGVHKAYKYFELGGIDLDLPTGCIMGFIGPNGAGKSTTIRILMGLVRYDRGEVNVLGLPMPARQSEIKFDLGFVSEDMRLYGRATIAWHMKWLSSIYPRWDQTYANHLLTKFDLRADQRVKGLSHGQSVKAALLMSLARHPRLLILDEPTTGLDPVVRHEVLHELMDVLKDEERSVLMSSHNTQDVEQVADLITFINKGEILESGDKETFLDRWRRVLFEAEPNTSITLPQGRHTMTRNGRSGTLVTGNFDESTTSRLEQTGASISEVQRMTLEEIFLARVIMSKTGDTTEQVAQ
jgi:ABC-2 type transport system ATP-binding protein